MAKMCEHSGERKKNRRRQYEYYSIPLRRFVWLLDRYNAFNGTDFSYGQAVQALKDGRIDFNKFKKGNGI